MATPEPPGQPHQPPRYRPPVPGHPSAGPPPGYGPPPQPGPGHPPRYVQNPGIPRAGETAMGRRVRINLERWRLLKYVWPVFLLFPVCGIVGGVLNKAMSAHQAPPLSPSEHATVVQRTASAFLQLIVADRLDDAYFKLCSYVQRKYTRSQFDQYAKAHPLESFTPAAISGTDPDVAYFTFTYTTGKTEEHGVHVYNGAVCGSPY